MKRIYINGRFLTQPFSGMQRYAGEMVSALDRLLTDGVDTTGIGGVEVLVPQQEYRRYDWARIPVRQVGKLQGHAWEQFDLARASRDGILINLATSGPLLHANSILVMHDAAVFVHPEHFSFGYRSFHRFLRPRLARRARQLITISEFSRRELAHWCGVPEDRFAIIGDSAEHILHVEADTSILERHGLKKGAYALTVGNQSPNKNISLAVQAFERAAPEGWLLAVAGGGVDKIFGNVQQNDSALVRRLGRVDDGQLRALYENAGLFLFPSRYEGFGVPPLEAMSVGCPVLSARTSAMPEILDNAVAYFKSDDADDFARHISLLCQDDTLRKHYAEEGRRHSKLYSWDLSGQSMLSVIRSLST